MKTYRWDDESEARWQHARAILEANDCLGFSSAAEAFYEIRRHRDWASRWEFNSQADINSIRAYMYLGY